MYNEQIELDTIATEHNFIMVGDPVMVNRFDNHDLHIEKHSAQLQEIKKSSGEQTKLNENQALTLEAHIKFHEEMKKRI